ncbi:fimbrial biogenesis outer membrane usher protein [Salinisphaera sp. USBA-960]|nr:fimbrial biogenesis outer membrane usher protein [Salifodinibacter halophilus]NNC25716.1 fimbrial biogenesis outer membrane usher protein [Salifodinibacter halophilus]
MHANIGGRVPHVGSIGLSYTDIDRRDRTSTELLNASYSTRLFRDVALSFFASQNLDDQTTSVALTLSLPLGSRTSVSTSYDRTSDSSRNRIEVQRNLPRGSGVGYRVAATDGHGRPDRGRGRVTARTPYGEYRAAATRYRGSTAYRLNASGGVAFTSDHAFLSRQIDDSFGVVEVGDYPDVTIYNDNHPVAETNANGAALIPDLRSFEDNRLSFEQADLPLDARLDKRNKTIVPGYRRGVLVKFDVGSPHGALLTVHRPNGEPLPAGATVRRVDDQQRFPVARRGEVWVTDLKQDNHLIAQWDDHRCRFTAKMPDNPGAVPHIGPLTCREME